MKTKCIPVETNVDILHLKSNKVDMRDNILIDKLKAILICTFYKLNGKAQGLSAIQCGEPYCAILLRYNKNNEPDVVFNPIVKFKLGARLSNEGCLSEGNQRYIVWRPMLAYVSYVQADGKVIKEWLPYKKARIFCHECDHLNGVLLQDKGRKVGK